MTITSPVRERILESATQLFATASLRSVSADKVITGAGTTKVTFYRHFPTKDDLVVAYLDAQLALLRAAVENQQAVIEEKLAVVEEERATAEKKRAAADDNQSFMEEPRSTPRVAAACAVLEWLAEANGVAACRSGFRGCVFINAAAEYPAEGNSVRAAVERYRSWLHDVVSGLLADLGTRAPGTVADQLIMLRDGAMVHGFMDDPTSVTASLVTAGRAIINANLPAPRAEHQAV